MGDKYWMEDFLSHMLFLFLYLYKMENCTGNCNLKTRSKYTVQSQNESNNQFYEFTEY